MVTDTEQREREVSQVAEASSRLGEIEGQVKLLVRRTEENARNAREDYRALDGKIDSTSKVLDGKIDRNFKELDGKIDRSVKDLTDKIDSTAKDLGDKIDKTAAEIRADMRSDIQDMRADMREMRAEIRRLMFWILSIGGTMGVAMVAAIVAFILDRLVF